MMTDQAKSHKRKRPCMHDDECLSSQTSTGVTPLYALYPNLQVPCEQTGPHFSRSHFVMLKALLEASCTPQSDPLITSFLDGVQFFLENVEEWRELTGRIRRHRGTISFLSRSQNSNGRGRMDRLGEEIYFGQKSILASPPQLERGSCDQIIIRTLAAKTSSFNERLQKIGGRFMSFQNLVHEALDLLEIQYKEILTGCSHGGLATKETLLPLLHTTPLFVYDDKKVAEARDLVEEVSCLENKISLVKRLYSVLLEECAR